MTKISYLFLDDPDNKITPQEIEAKLAKAGRYLEVIYPDKHYTLEDYMINDCEIMRPTVELLNWKHKAEIHAMNNQHYKEYLCIILNGSIYSPILNSPRLPGLNFLNKIIKNYDMDIPHVALTGEIPKAGDIQAIDFIKMAANKEVYKCYKNLDDLVSAMDYKEDNQYRGKTSILNEINFQKLTKIH